MSNTILPTNDVENRITSSKNKDIITKSLPQSSPKSNNNNIIDIYTETNEQQNSRLTIDNIQLKHDISDLQLQLSNKEDIVKQQNNTITALNEQIKNLTTQLNDTKQTINTLQLDKQELQQELLYTEDALDEAYKQSAPSTIDDDNTTDTTHNKQDTVLQCNEILHESINIDISTLDNISSIEQARQRIDALIETISEYMSQQQSYDTALEQHKYLLARYRDDNTRLDTLYKDRNHECNQQYIENQYLSETIDRLYRQVHELGQITNKDNQTVTAQQIENNNLKNDLQYTKQKLTEALQQLQLIRNELDEERIKLSSFYIETINKLKIKDKQYHEKLQQIKILRDEQINRIKRQKTAQ